MVGESTCNYSILSLGSDQLVGDDSRTFIDTSLKERFDTGRTDLRHDPQKLREIADRIKAKREGMGFKTQLELSQRTKIPQATMSRLETGESSISKKNLTTIARVLECSESYLLDGIEKESESPQFGETQRIGVEEEEGGDGQDDRKAPVTAKAESLPKSNLVQQKVTSESEQIGKAVTGGGRAPFGKTGGQGRGQTVEPEAVVEVPRFVFQLGVHRSLLAGPATVADAECRLTLGSRDTLVEGLIQRRLDCVVVPRMGMSEKLLRCASLMTHRRMFQMVEVNCGQGKAAEEATVISPDTAEISAFLPDTGKLRLVKTLEELPTVAKELSVAGAVRVLCWQPWTEYVREIVETVVPAESITIIDAMDPDKSHLSESTLDVLIVQSQLEVLRPQLNRFLRGLDQSIALLNQNLMDLASGTRRRGIVGRTIQEISTQLDLHDADIAAMTYAGGPPFELALSTVWLDKPPRGG